jgi:molecular chaperone HtpG
MKQFQTESKKLLDLMINSIYTNKDIFLRELVSNASDAIDKLVFQSLTDQNLQVDRDALAIEVSFDKDARCVTVSDNGIGMTADELDRNLGTIAHSGSEQFKRDTADAAVASTDVDVIGQFGVGFYASFMVAERVRVTSRTEGAEQAFAWESNGLDGYDVAPASDGEQPGRGTTVTLYLRPSTEDNDTDQLLSEWHLRGLIRTYSNYVHHPIKMLATKRRELPRPEDAGDDYKPEYESYTELETVNSIKPIWGKRASEVDQADYNEFYKATFHDYADPARTISFHAEGRINYDVLLFIPSVAPFDLYSKDYQKGLALYQSNVLIQEKCADLVPDYYNFVRGVVDSPDVSLNISRETLQQSSQLTAIARQVEKKIRAELVKMLADDRAGYEAFFGNFGRGLKFGIYASYGMKTDLADLLLFWSAKENKLVTFAEYVASMADGQEQIYFAAGDSRERLAKTPAVKNALGHGYDVLLCTEDVDEFMFQALRAYHVAEVPAAEEDGEPTPARDVEFANVADAKLDLASEEEKEKAASVASEHEDLLQTVKDALGEKVAKVEVAAGLGDAPAVLAAEGAVSLEMERLMSQGPEAGYAPKAERVLQLNPDHPVFAKLAAAQETHDATKVTLYAEVLLDQALLVAGMPVEDPVAFAENVCKLM